jgi:hypothetical protein
LHRHTVVSARSSALHHGTAYERLTSTLLYSCVVAHPVVRARIYTLVVCMGVRPCSSMWLGCRPTYVACLVPVLRYTHLLASFGCALQSPHLCC